MIMSNVDDDTDVSVAQNHNIDLNNSVDSQSLSIQNSLDTMLLYRMMSEESLKVFSVKIFVMYMKTLTSTDSIIEEDLPRLLLRLGKEFFNNRLELLFREEFVRDNVQQDPSLLDNADFLSINLLMNKMEEDGSDDLASSIDLYKKLVDTRVDILIEIDVMVKKVKERFYKAANDQKQQHKDNIAAMESTACQIADSITTATDTVKIKAAKLGGTLQNVLREILSFLVSNGVAQSPIDILRSIGEKTFYTGHHEKGRNAIFDRDLERQYSDIAVHANLLVQAMEDPDTNFRAGSIVSRASTLRLSRQSSSSSGSSQVLSVDYVNEFNTMVSLSCNVLLFSFSVVILYNNPCFLGGKDRHRQKERCNTSEGER